MAKAPARLDMPQRKTVLLAAAMAVAVGAAAAAPVQHLLFYTCCTPEVANQCDECFVPAAQGGWCTTGFTNDTSLAVEGAAVGIHALFAVHDIFFTNGAGGQPGGLRPGYAQRWAAALADIAPLLSNGTLLGVFLGDELITAKRIPVAAVTTAADMVAAGLAAHGRQQDALVFINESPPTFSPGFMVPYNITHVSIDDYGLGSANNTRAWYNAHLYPSMHPHQLAFTVPGAYGSRLNPSKSLDEYDVEMAQQANDFYEWAKSDPKLVGLAPWHWDSRSAKVVSQYKEVGTADLPKTRAAWIEIGHDIQRQVASAQLA